MPSGVSSPPKLVLIDAFSLLYRAFYALPELRAKDGTPTQAVYGFALMLLRLLEEERPEFVAIVTDRSGPTFRDELYADYKAHRPDMPEDLAAQVPLFYELVEALNIPLLGADGYEADDCIAAAAAQAAERGLRTVIVTGDRDLLQLVNPGVEVVLTRRGIKDTERLDEQGVREKLGVSPRQVPELKALTGDPSDNIPGVPGVGPKTAARWLERFGTLDDLLARADEVSGKAGENLRRHAEQVRLSRRLATIERDVPLDLDWSRLEHRSPDWSRLVTLFERLEFHSLLRRLTPRMEAENAAAPPSAPEPVTPVSAARAGTAGSLVATAEEAAQLAERIGGVRSLVAVPLLQGDHPLEIRARALILAWEGGDAVVPLESPDLPEGQVKDLLAALCGVNGRELVVPDAKGLIHALRPWGVPLPEGWVDVGLAVYLLHAGRGTMAVEQVLSDVLGEPLVPPAELLLGDSASRRGRKQDPLDDPGAFVKALEREAPGLAAYAHGVRRAWPALWEQLRGDGLLTLYRELETPLTAVLAQMERTGIRVDGEYLATMAGEMNRRLRELTERIHSLAGESFNVNSPRQLAAILYDKLGLPVVKRTKTGPSTDADVLEQLADHHPLPAAVLDYRQVAKLMSTYVEALPRLIHPGTGRVHTSFNQTVTATGRLSSAHPNLQNIPVRTEEGRLIRGAFVAGSPDQVILTADYSQIELRVLAHLSEDETLVEAFRRGEDIHARTASEVFGKPIGAVTSEERAAAKAINFGIIYGISSFGLARGTGLTRAEAQTFIDGYFERYPRVKAYLDRLVADAKRNGYVTTLAGRRRYLPELKSRQWARRQFAERAAMNTPIQGSAADIIKTSMVRLASRLEQTAVPAKLLLQVHDELVLECPRSEAERVGRLVKDAMETAYRLHVPLVVELRAGPNWKDTEPLELGP